jgi:hypothetical protein
MSLTDTDNSELYAVELVAVPYLFSSAGLSEKI